MTVPPRNHPRLADLDIEITTERLRLRAWHKDDVEAVWPWVSDPAFPKEMSWKEHADRSETVDYIRGTHAARAEGSGLVWVIEHEGKAAGSISLEAMVWGRRAWRMDQAELGYWLAPPLWRKGMMTEAAAAVIKFGFETLGLHKVVVGCLAQNDASRRVIEKSGFRFVGRYNEDVYRDGAWHDHLRYELIVSDSDDMTSTRRFKRPGTL